ncbi:hypothetical protein [Vibrio gazogenes]|uniref:Uncharacterized protein n=1 Tax=Vibrio gazogenes TaxID=687 RepID=A0A1Z2SKT5_VIBGA|nr:hypothetical protein [Vibrio gazogenes]ASA57813.1 hypothetical protein BSQ33_18960 [Vibrio gazogenes]
MRYLLFILSVLIFGCSSGVDTKQSLKIEEQSIEINQLKQTSRDLNNEIEELRVEIKLKSKDINTNSDELADLHFQLGKALKNKTEIKQLIENLKSGIISNKSAISKNNKIISEMANREKLRKQREKETLSRLDKIEEEKQRKLDSLEGKARLEFPKINIKE